MHDVFITSNFLSTKCQKPSSTTCTSKLDALRWTKESMTSLSLPLAIPLQPHPTLHKDNAIVVEGTSPRWYGQRIHRYQQSPWMLYSSWLEQYVDCKLQVIKSDSIESSDDHSTRTTESDHPGHLWSLKERMEKPHRRTVARGASLCSQLGNEEEGKIQAADVTVEAIWVDWLSVLVLVWFIPDDSAVQYK